MATVTARSVDDDDYSVLAQTAEEHGRSISEELRLMIAEHAKKRRSDRRVAEMKAFLKRNPLKLPDGMTSLDLLREERDSW